METVFIRWTWVRAVLHNGWWLVTSVYLVVDAGLSPAQLVLIGSVQSAFALVFEVPAGVIADTISRKWSLVISQVLMGTAMLATGLFESFPALLATQVLWGISWTFASGSDVALITDELDRPDRINFVLTRAARAQLTGAATGLITLGLLAWATRRDVTIVVAGAAMMSLALYVGFRFTEHNFVPTRTARWSTSWTTFVRGVTLVRRSRAILLIFAATFLVNGASDAAGRLTQKQLIDLGLPPSILWFTALGVVGLVVGALVLRLVTNRINSSHAATDYALAALVGVLSMLLLAFARDPVLGAIAVVLLNGIVNPLTRVISTIWINSRTTADIRATTHSFLAQLEYLGEIVCGVTISTLAGLTTLPLALTGCAVLFGATAVLMRSSR
ncbi:MFS transporter [Kribbella jiaozuonensis]|uniref:MFS transporter n=1 Tax=Kribbella jiaozuonensis TaxID=2575441 RepID=A0A4U3LTT6_9ACTN|nr:MFS transporter [Kribbella jiaozuonensis]TKK79220.1 MFS transporter [Kribbella jiaozuonensis]TKK83290.1 MFS transporter [Kribbella jiaozuonensis]